MAHLDLPHFDLPLRWERSGRKNADGSDEIRAASVEQDTIKDIENQVFAVVATPIGFRDENPEFGVRSPLFGQAPLDAKLIQEAISEWVPNASADVTEYGDAIYEAQRTIEIHLTTEEDQDA